MLTRRGRGRGYVLEKLDTTRHTGRWLVHFGKGDRFGTDDRGVGVGVGIGTEIALLCTACSLLLGCSAGYSDINTRTEMGKDDGSTSRDASDVSRYESIRIDTNRIRY